MKMASHSKAYGEYVVSHNMHIAAVLTKTYDNITVKNDSQKFSEKSVKLNMGLGILPYHTATIIFITRLFVL
jgi:hypothetical protein